MNKRTIQAYLLGVLTILLVLAVAVPAAAATAGKTIQIFPGISIFVDDVKLEPCDANGNPVEVFVYNGTTYLPVRAISEALGKPIQWDGKTRSVYIGEHSSVAPSKKSSAEVIRVIDGDTIIVNLNGQEETVRLIGVDAPESVHPTASKNTEAGFAASEFAKVYLDGKQVELEFDVQERDNYGHLLAYVYVDGKMFNEKLLQVGHASIATYPPNVKYVDRFTEIVNNRDPSIPSGEYLDGYMKAPTIIYTTTAEENKMDDTFLYAEGVVKGFNSTGTLKYFILATDDGDISVAYEYNGSEIVSPLSNVNVGDSAKIGFLYLGQSGVTGTASGVFMEILEKNTTTLTPSPAPTESVNRTVYITKTGKKYHYSSTCNGGTYYPSTLQEARSRGLTPCNKCVN